MDLKEDDPPQVFVNWQNLNAVLAQANTGGVKCTLLMRLDGALLSVAGETTIEKTIGALVANIWKGYEGAKDAVGAEGLYFMIIDCEDGRLAVSKLSKFLLCMYADKRVEIGLLKNKTTIVFEHLKPLKQVYPNAE